MMWRAYDVLSAALVSCALLCMRGMEDRHPVVTRGLLALSAAWPAVWSWRHLQEDRGPRRSAAGLCPTCGYDLRATPERCPECGTEAGKA